MEEKFIRLADLQKFPIRKDHYDKEHGNEHFIYGIETMFEYIDELPKYEIAVRGEVNVTDDVCKALVCCLNGDVNKSQVEVCTPCPFFYEGNCTDLLKQNALDVILHQRATIEFLQKAILENEQRHIKEMVEFNCEPCACALLDQRDKAQSEVERLTRICDSYALQYGTVRDKQAVVDEIKAEAIKEFAWRLKNILTPYPEAPFCEMVGSLDIDALVEEMTEGEKCTE